MARGIKVSILAAAVLFAAGCRTAPGRAPANRTPVTAIKTGNPVFPERLVGGFHRAAQAEGHWCWTARAFQVSIDVPDAGESPAFLEFDFSVPQEILPDRGRVTIGAKVNGVALGRRSYDKAGRTLASWKVERNALHQTPARVEFDVDRTFQTPEGPRGLASVEIALRTLEETAQFRETAGRRARQAYWKILESRKDVLPASSQDELIRIYQELPVWECTWFHGIKIYKNPVDLWVVEQILHEIRPQFVVETGTFRGASALVYAQAFEGLGLLDSRVLTVDIGDFNQAAAAQRLWKYVTFYHGSSTDPDIVAELRRLTRGARTVVALDSDHSMNHVLRELRMYAPMVSPGSYLIVEDTHMDGAGTHGYGTAEAGPLAAVEQFLTEDAGRDFERDMTREPFIMSWNTGAWLKRKAPHTGK